MYALRPGDMAVGRKRHVLFVEDERQKSLTALNILAKIDIYLGFMNLQIQRLHMYELRLSNDANVLLN